MTKQRNRETETHHNRAGLEQLLQPAVQLDPKVPVLREVHAREHVHDLLVRSRLEHVLGDNRRVRHDEPAPRCEEPEAQRLRVCQRDRVEHDLDGRVPSELRDLGRELRGGQGAVEHVRRTQGLEQLRVVRGRGREDG